MRYEFTIPDFTPRSANEYTFAKVGTRIRKKKGDRDLVAHYAQQSGIPKATGKRRISLIVTLAKGGRAVDPDNAWKGLLDGCKQAGLLVNDSHKWVELGEYTIRRGERRSTLVILEDVE